MRILAIETSCDETAISFIEAKGGLKSLSFKILKNLVASQIKIHRPFGGVVPSLAKREHLKNLPLLWQRIMNNELGIKGKIFTSGRKNKKPIIHNSRFIIPDLIAVTVGPGLEPALWTGINFAKELRDRIMNYESGIKNKNKKTIIHNSRFIIPIIGVSHLDGHLYSFLLPHKETPSFGKTLKNIFPSVSLIISGGHTTLLLVKDLTHYKKLGETRDDAVGEAFDKVARLLNLPYPGGPEIERIAKKGNLGAINFPRPMINQKNYDFSFSGLKTSVLYYLRENPSAKKENIAVSFQEAAFDVLISKTLRAAEEFNAKSIMISGGVAANKKLKKEFQKAIKKLPITNYQLLITEFPTDNAAMIAVAGYINHLRKKNRRLIAQGNLSI